jgi:hypothetical protein
MRGTPLHMGRRQQDVRRVEGSRPNPATSVETSASVAVALCDRYAFVIPKKTGRGSAWT